MLLRYTLLLLLMTLGGKMNTAWGQTDYSGTYYIGTVDQTNGFYLCPTEEWYYYDGQNDTYTNSPNGNPFLTTYKCKSTSGYNASNALWTIEKHPSQNYYYIKHDGKYLTYNKALFTNKGRVRVHLEDSPANDDYALFKIEYVSASSSYDIISKYAEDNNIDPDSNKPRKYLNINKGNKQSLKGKDDKVDNIEVGGIIGLWTAGSSEGQGTGRFFLEDYITRPTIAFNSGNNIEITAVQPDATLIYTTDGTTPTATNGTKVNTSSVVPDLAPTDGVHTIKAVAVVNGELSNVATFTTPVLCGTNHTYLIQSQNNGWESTTDFHFYMIPGDDEGEDPNKITKVNTTSLFRPSMEWYFLNAGVEAGVQYYYIVNNSAKDNLDNPYYLCYDGTNKVHMDVYTNDPDDNKFKFKIVESPTSGTFNIYPYGENIIIYKDGSNTSSTAIGSYTYNANNANNANFRWKFVLPTSLDKTAPFTASSSSIGSYTYYKLRSSGDEYYIKAPASADANATMIVASSADDNTYWYLEEAAAATNDDWLTYYYIRNAKTGDYLYYANGNPSDDNAAFKTSTTSGDADRYQFAWAHSTTKDYYFIVPKMLRDQTMNNFSTMNRNGNNLRVQKVRATGSSAWLFSSVSFTCAQPVISWSAEGKGYVITPTESDAKIYYRIGEGELTPSTGTLYTGAISVAGLGVESATIRAIAARNSDGSDKSTEVSLTVNRVEIPTKSTEDGKVELACTTDGARIYYEMDVTSPGTPNSSTSTLYEGPIDGAANKYIKAIAVKDGWINSPIFTSELIEFACATPVIRKTSPTTFTIECNFPTSGVEIRYTIGNGTQDAPTASTGLEYSGPVTFDINDLPFTIKAIAVAENYTNSEIAIKELAKSLLPGDDGYYEISSDLDFKTFIDMVDGEGDGAGYKYKITTDINASGTLAISKPFTGELMGVAKSDGTFPTISGLSHPIFYKIDGGVVKNIILELGNTWSNKNSGDDETHAGAIANVVEGTSDHVACIYNCGILSGSVSGSNCVGSLVGLLGKLGDSEEDKAKCYARVINCFSYATVSGGTNAAGIVGYNAFASNQTNLKTMVMNCMFYGNGASGMKPVYGGQRISNAGANGINNYNYYRNGEDVTFDDSYANFDAYFCTLPADEEYLTRFEYYRSILNSNRQLCTYWVTNKKVTSTNPDEAVQTAADTALIAKWVLDPEIAPYPILKKWGKYPSVINQDKTRVWDPRTKDENGSSLTPHWVNRSTAPDYQGKQLGTISVTVNAGAKHAGTGATTRTLPSVIVMDMDTLNHDYCYAKIQLPYYNEVFGDASVQLPAPSAEDYTSKWKQRYGGNYTDYVVTGWKITVISGGTPGTFKGYAVPTVPDATQNVSAGKVTPDDPSNTAWEDGFNFADRNCTNKDLYSKSGRVFAQGGYYYVPEGVKGITIEAYWGKAVYLHNSGHSIDRVNVAAVADGDGAADNTGPDFGSSFTPAGTLATTFQTYDVKTNLQEAIAGLTNNASYTVYDQAIVLVGNVQVKNRGGSLNSNNNGTRPFTIMSCDLDMDNEPDYCLQFQQRNKVNRPAIHPVRFDFLPVPELGLAIRTNTLAYAIGLMVPKGHFEITETSFMHTTQFEYDADGIGKVESPIILNGGHFEQIVVRQGTKNKVNFFLLGGHFRMKRFTPGLHASNITTTNKVRHCVVNAIGGDYPEFYLSGIYNPDKEVNADNPHCYINGGKFGMLAGAGYEQVDGDVTFKIDHAIIDEFYGGGINAAKPVTGKIDVTINNSLVDKYCGGPKVGVMSTVDGKLKTVTTNATGTTFGVFYGGGNGGTSYYRHNQYDNTREFPTTDAAWKANNGNYTPNFNAFTPLNQENVNAAYKNSETENWGYHAEYEFEVFNASNGLNTKDDVIRLYYHWAQFGTTITGDVSNTLTDCTVLGSFFGGGNLANVTGNVTSILKGETHIYGSAFAGGYSASIPSFPVHDKSTVTFPAKDKAGNVAEQGSLDYYQDGGKDRMYTWCYKNASGKVFPEGVVIPQGASAGAKQNSVFQYNGKWYVLTTESLENLGAVTGDTQLTVSEDCQIDGNVFGGGDSSIVDGNTTVTLKDDATIEGNVFGGGNKAEVTGSTTVNVED